MDEPMIDTTYWPTWPEATEGNRVASDVSLQDANRDIWTGLPVMIMRGKNKGVLARVLGTGSGWVQIRLAPEDGSDPMLAEEAEEMSKRAVDLHVVKGYEDIPPPPVATAQSSGTTGDEDGAQESGEGDSQAEDIQAGDHVRITEGSYEGKIGKVINVDRGGGVLTLSVRNVANIVLKRRVEVELTTKGNGADSPSSQGEGGRPSRLSARRGAELLNKRVQITSTGQFGVVVRIAAGGGYIISIESPDTGEETLKRKDEIRVVEDYGDEEGMSQSGDNDAGTAEDVESKDEAPTATGRIRSNARASNNSPKITRGVGRRGAIGSRSQYSANAGSGIEKGGDETSGGTQKGTKRTGRQAGVRGTRNGAAAAKRQQREITPQQYSQTRLEAARRARQELIVGFLSRSREKLERTMGMTSRPNLQEWLEQIQGCEDEDADEEEDEYTPLVYDPAFCPTCLLEKESPEEFCWNAACWECPVYDPSAVPLMESALPIKGGIERFSALAQSPRKPGFIDYSSIPLITGRAGGVQLVPFQQQQQQDQRSKQQQEEEDEIARSQQLQQTQRQALPKIRLHSEEIVVQDEEEPHKQTTVNIFSSRFKAGRKRAEMETIASPLVTFSIRAPSQWLGENLLKGQNGAIGPVGYFGVGWKEGLVYEEPMLPHGEQQDKVDTALDFRWRRGMVQ